MVSADEHSLLALFEQVMPAERLQELEGKEKRKGGQDQIYTLPVVMEMMLLQRLTPEGTQQETVQQLLMGRLDHLVSDCKRIREKKVSSATGSYSQACQRVPLNVLEKVCDETLAELAKRIEREPELRRPLLLLDGTTFSVKHEKELLEEFPPARNQYGKAHWGILQMVALHDVHTGIALRPAWGAMYGANAVSEQRLAERVLEQSPVESVILGDSNFGIFVFVFLVVRNQRQAIVRLTKRRAQSLGAGKLLPTGEARITWRASRQDRRNHPELPADAEIQGRLIAVSCYGLSEPLYLFTTLEEDWKTIVALYAKRWNLELDLRTLKQTLRMNQLRGRSKASVEKELLIATVAYGLVRTFMAAAARRAGLSPRELSFTAAYGLLNAAARKLCSPDRAVRLETLDRVLGYIAKSKLPKRRKTRSYPRAVWGFRRTFPRRGPQKPDLEEQTK